MITKIVQLVAAADDTNMDLKAGEKYYPRTGADCVVGLDEKIADGQKTYTEATDNTAGLMSAADKKKLDSIDTGPPVTSFQGTITSTSTDFNSLTTEGHYEIHFSPNVQGKNGPKDGNWGLLDVKSAGRTVVQTYYADVNTNVYVRNCYDDTAWTTWREIAF